MMDGLWFFRFLRGTWGVVLQFECYGAKEWTYTPIINGVFVHNSYFLVFMNVYHRPKDYLMIIIRGIMVLITIVVEIIIIIATNHNNQS